MSKDEDYIHQEHDKLFKAFFRIKETVIDYINNFLPPELRDYINLEDLKQDETAYLSTAKMKAFYSDVFYRTSLKFINKSFAFAFLFEHKFVPENYVDLQILNYFNAVWQTDIANNRPPTFILPIVIYQGEADWEIKSYTGHFKDFPTTLLKFLPQFDYHLTNVNKLDASVIENLKGKSVLQSLFLAYKFLNDKEYAKNNYAEFFKSFEGKPELLELLRIFIGYVNQQDNYLTISYLQRFNNKLVQHKYNLQRKRIKTH